MLGIVIVNYRSDSLTEKFVKEEIPKVNCAHTVVVVDNGATEEEAEALSTRLGGIKVIASENRGFAVGNNIGARWLRDNCNPDYILFSNNDIQISSSGVLPEMIKRMKSNPEIGVIGPEVVGLDGKRQSPEPYMGLWKRFVWMYLATPFMSEKKKSRRFFLNYPEGAEEGRHYKLMGAFFMVEADSFFKAGMFDENTFLFAEEPILSERMDSIGKCCYFLPSVRVVHAHGETIKKHYDASKSAMMQFDSMAYYYQRYRGYGGLSISIVRIIYRLILLTKRAFNIPGL